MSAIVEELTIAAAPESVFNALTQQDELARWWANEARVKPEVALLVNFAFGRRRVSFSLRRTGRRIEHAS